MYPLSNPIQKPLITKKNLKVAIKIPNKQNFTPTQLESFKKVCFILVQVEMLDLKILMKEMNIWSRLYHPNICLFMGASLSSEKVLIVTEKLEGDLESLIKKDKKLSLYQKMKMVFLNKTSPLI